MWQSCDPYHLSSLHKLHCLFSKIIFFLRILPDYSLESFLPLFLSPSLLVKSTLHPRLYVQHFCLTLLTFPVLHFLISVSLSFPVLHAALLITWSFLPSLSLLSFQSFYRFNCSISSFIAQYCITECISLIPLFSFLIPSCCFFTLIAPSNDVLIRFLMPSFLPNHLKELIISFFFTS